MAILIWLWQWTREKWWQLVGWWQEDWSEPRWRESDQVLAQKAKSLGREFPLLAVSRQETLLLKPLAPLPPPDPDFKQVFGKEVAGQNLLGLNLRRPMAETEMLAAIVARGWAPVRPSELQQLFAGPINDLPLGWYHALGLTTTCQAWPGERCHFYIAKFESEAGPIGQSAFWMWEQKQWPVDPREVIVVTPLTPREL